MEVAQLEYGRPAGRWGWRRRGRWLVLLAGVCALTLCGFQWGRGWYERGRVLYGQHRCWKDRPGADCVAWESEAVAAKILLAGKAGEYVAMKAWPRQVRAGRRPKCVDVVPPLEGEAWGSSERAVLFVHGRRAKGGAECLVVLQLDESFFGSQQVRVDAGVYIPTWRGPVEVDTGEMLLVDGDGRSLFGQRGLRVYAGQVDDGDESHFTIRYALGAEEGMVDGWLLAGGVVRMKVREGSRRTQENPVGAGVAEEGSEFRANGRMKVSGDGGR